MVGLDASHSGRAVVVVPLLVCTGGRVVDNQTVDGGDGLGAGGLTSAPGGARDELHLEPSHEEMEDEQDYAGNESKVLPGHRTS